MLTLVIALTSQIGAAANFHPGLTPLKVTVNKHRLWHDVSTVFVLPGEQLKFQNNNRGQISIEFPGRKIVSFKKLLHWKPPDREGHYLAVLKGSEGKAIRLNIFVMVPFSRVKNGRIKGYRIGSYPKVALKDLRIYQRPRGFVEVNRKQMRLKVSPHFTLGQFLCKQKSGFPKFLVLREALLTKLEFVLQKLNELGHFATTLTIMSGYRTPFYNKLIGNVKYSRHQWGGAADVFIDEKPKDGVIDDLNKDGQNDYKDADIIYDLLDQSALSKKFRKLRGGLGRYKKNSVRGPFVHIDVRGNSARWGY